jgi:putative phosphoribosyl transferase
MRFANRCVAGRQLVAPLAAMHLADPVILALPRGGVPLATEVGEALRAHVGVLVVRKIGAPGHREFGVGAIAEAHAGAAVTIVIDRDVVEGIGISRESLDRVVADEQRELERRVQRYRGGRPLPPMTGRDVVIVDDGLATGVTADAAVRSVRSAGADRVVVAAPVGSREAVRRLRRVADQVVCVDVPDDFVAVGRWYDDFAEVTDDDVIRVLDPATTERARP